VPREGVGTGSATPTDITAPGQAQSLALSQVSTARTVLIDGRGEVTLLWTNPSDTDFTGVVVLRDRTLATGLASFTVPTDGRFYKRGDVVGGAVVIYSEQGLSPGGSESLVDENLSPNYLYHYAIYSHDRSYFYSSGSTITAGSL